MFKSIFLFINRNDNVNQNKGAQYTIPPIISGFCVRRTINVFKPIVKW